MTAARRNLQIYMGLQKKNPVDHSHFKNIFIEKCKKKTIKTFEHQVICQKLDHNFKQVVKSCTNVITVLTFEIIKWVDTDLGGLHRVARRLLKNPLRTSHFIYNRIYTPWKERGRDFVNMHSVCRTQEIHISNNLR